jgi:hypothetical protein
MSSCTTCRLLPTAPVSVTQSLSAPARIARSGSPDSSTLITTAAPASRAGRAGDSDIGFVVIAAISVASESIIGGHNAGSLYGRLLRVSVSFSE